MLGFSLPASCLGGVRISPKDNVKGLNVSLQVLLIASVQKSATHSL